MVESDLSMKLLGPLLRRLGRGAEYAVPAFLLLMAAVVRFQAHEGVELVRNRVFDAYQRARPRPYEEAPIRIIDLDDESLEKLGQWPWPRTQVARLVRRLGQLGASTVAFDIVFSEPDRTSPKKMLDIWPDIPELASMRASARSGRLPDHDQVLASAFGQANVVTGFVLTPAENAARPELKAGFTYAGDNPIVYLPDFSGAVTALPVLEKAAAGNGSFSIIPDQDGVIRRAPLLFRRGADLYPSLSLEALRIALGGTAVSVKSSGASGIVSFGQHTGISMLRLSGQGLALKIPTDELGRIWIHYTAEAPGRTVPAWKIFEKGFPAESLAGSICFVGTSAAGLKDLRTTPLQPAAPGVEVHAQAAEQIFLQKFLERPDWADGAEFVYMAALGGPMIFLLPQLGAAWGGLLALLSGGGAFWFSWHAFTAWHWLVDPLYPFAVVLAVYLSSTFVTYWRTENEKKQVRGAFSRYMSPVLVEQLAAHPEKLQLGGEMKEMTLLFTDIRGFTTISEQFDPHGLTRLLNRFLTPMTGLILEHRGTIDKYMGDCIMAFWNAPLDDPEHAVNSCRAALAMRAALEKLNATLRKEAEKAKQKLHEIHIGIGLNTGPACVGNMGSDQRFDYSVIGDTVNLASRLEGQSKTYGVDIVIGPGTFEKAKDFATLELDLIRVKGKNLPVRIHALMGNGALAGSPAFGTLAAKHAEMLAAYRGQDWEKARGLLGECRGMKFPLDGLYGLYAARIDAFIENPPKKEWDGVFVATSK